MPHSNVGPSSPQAPSQGSPKHHRPAPTASAPPTMQHFQAAPSKLPFSSAQTGAQAIAEQASASLISQARSPTPVIPHSTPLQVSVVVFAVFGLRKCGIYPSLIQVQDESTNNQSSGLPTVSVYTLFNSMAQQPMWGRENESQKPVNFAAVTGGGTSQTNSQPKFIDQEPPPQVSQRGVYEHNLKFS